MKIKSFDRQNLAALRDEFQAALDKVAKAHGLQAKLGKISFGEKEFRTQLGVCVPAISKSDDGAITKISPALAAAMKAHGLKRTQGKQGQVLIDVSLRSYSYPFIYSQDGRKFKCSIEQAQRIFG